MPGQIKARIEAMIAKRAHGNPTLLITSRTKLMMEGIYAERYDENSEDDPEVLEKLATIEAKWFTAKAA